MYFFLKHILLWVPFCVKEETTLQEAKIFSHLRFVVVIHNTGSRTWPQVTTATVKNFYRRESFIKEVLYSIFHWTICGLFINLAKPCIHSIISKDALYIRILRSFKLSSFQDLGRFLLNYFITFNMNVQIIGRNNLLKAILKVTSSGDKFALVWLIFHT